MQVIKGIFFLLLGTFACQLFYGHWWWFLLICLVGGAVLGMINETKRRRRQERFETRLQQRVLELQPEYIEDAFAMIFP
jgi:hypothetical protein